jgi:hypothetical protein
MPDPAGLPPRRQRKPSCYCLTGSLTEQAGLAYPWLAVDQKDTAAPAFSAAQQAIDEPPLPIAPPHHHVITSGAQR